MSDVIKIAVELDIPIERIKDLLCCAFEGGTHYWAVVTDEGTTQEDMDKFGAEYYHEIPALGGEFPIFDREEFYDGEEDDKLDPIGVLNMDGIKKALQLMAKGQDKDGKDCPGYKEHWDWFMAENEDANTGDLLVQLALFGKEVYA